jgi:hypothetical protein
MKKRISTALLFGLGTVLPSQAQNPPITGTTIVTATYQNQSLYASQGIELQPGFTVTTPGFEALIVQLPAIVGSWSSLMPWGPAGNEFVGIHMHVLPTGKVLSWEGHNANNHDEESHAYVWDPNTNSYELCDNNSSNLFCSGHSFLPNGRLLVAGGHYSDGNPLPPDSPPGTQPGYVGLRDANIFDPFSKQWQTKDSTPGIPEMTDRRWYPTNTSLSNGEVLVTAGQIDGGTVSGGSGRQSTIPEVWQTTGNWRRLTTASRTLPLYPWMFLAPNGRIFNAGPNTDTRYLNTQGTGAWGPEVFNSQYGWRGNGTAVMYNRGQIALIGGTRGGGVTPTIELIDLTTASPQFRFGTSMRFSRHHVNSTLLPDGTVLVTGGTTANDTNDANGVLPAEIWTPPALGTTGGGSWATMAAMSTPRLYHSTAVLLPDGRVLSAGGGQGGGFMDHRDAEIFSPPYLFRGPRPQLTAAPQAVRYGQAFAVSTPNAAAIAKVTWIRLSSVTHSINMNQRINYLPFTASSTGLTLTAPATANDCPPGHYMLFLVDANGVPSVARIVSINVN